jgi:hypothetical protein
MDHVHVIQDGRELIVAVELVLLIVTAVDHVTVTELAPVILDMGDPIAGMIEFV